MADEFDPAAYAKYLAEEAPAPQAAAQFDPAAYAKYLAEPEPSVGMDVLKSIGSGLAQGAQGAAVAGPLAIDLLSRGVEKAANYLAPGSSFTQSLEQGRQQAEQNRQAIQRLVGQRSIDYQPQTVPGQFAGTMASFLPAAVAGPGGIGRRVGQALGAGLGSEAAGQATAGTDYEPAARAAGALAGGVMTPAVARRIGTPFPVAPERAAALQTLRDEGVIPPASMATGSKTLKYAESEIGGGRYADAVERMNKQFTAAALRRAGIDAEAATPEVLNQAATDIGSQFDKVAANNPVISVQGFGPQADAIHADYQALTGAKSPLLAQLSKRIGNSIISGDDYTKLRSDIARYARKTSSQELEDALNGFKNKLDDVVQAGLNPADAQAWAQARRQWFNLLTLKKAVGGPTEGAAFGQISPAKLSQAIESMGGQGTYAMGRGDFADLARAGNAIMRQAADSGTAGRLATWAVPLALADLLSGHTMTGMTVAARAAAGPALMSRLAQRILANQRYANQALGPASAAGRRSLSAIAGPAAYQAEQPPQGAWPP